jgi:hypothetical protein
MSMHTGVQDFGVGNGHSGVEAAGTGESNAPGRNRLERARDGTVGVAQYVMSPPYMGERVVSMEADTCKGVSP